MLLKEIPLSKYTMKDFSLYIVMLLRYQLILNKLLDEVEQNIVLCQWRADQLFAEAEGRGK